MGSDIHKVLREHWGYDKFRPLQEDIIRSVLGGNDTLALLPTGGGKSLCFQVPALASEGLCLVISPLIALMKDQVENLRKRNITAFAIYSGMSRKEVESTFRTAAASNCKFLYLSPERLETRMFKEYLPALNVTLIAVDEAHCISQWGYDFRPPYLRIAALREELPDVPILALTASATHHVQNDICNRLDFKSKNVFRQSFERPNLSYSAFRPDSKINRIIDILKKVSGTGIVYCKSRKRTREFSEMLNMQGIRADYYHAGLSQEQRNSRQQAWIQNEIRVIVCTNAFGMGIDKPDVRIVIHADAPDCLENYYQEAGRAGRDGKKSYAVLLYSAQDCEDLKKQVDTRFPPMQEIRRIYQHLVNHLQLPAGTGEGQYYTLDFQAFVKQYSLSPQLVMAALRALEQEELLQFSEQVFVASQIEIIAGRDRLNELESQNPALDKVLKYLLRTYEGILDQPVSVSERLIAGGLKIREPDLENKLNTLHSAALLRYTPQKEEPQVYFLRNRMRSEDLSIDYKRYEERKKLYQERVQVMLDFLTTTTCRSQFIASYFGDAATRECGICDSCLAKRKTKLNNSEFEDISRQILGELSAGIKMRRSHIVDRYQQYPKSKVLEVIQFLHSEDRITMSETGDISLKH